MTTQEHDILNKIAKSRKKPITSFREIGRCRRKNLVRKGTITESYSSLENYLKDMSEPTFYNISNTFLSTISRIEPKGKFDLLGLCGLAFEVLENLLTSYPNLKLGDINLNEFTLPKLSQGDYDMDCCLFKEIDGILDEVLLFSLKLNSRKLLTEADSFLTNNVMKFLGNCKPRKVHSHCLCC
jgi:hypothetical protein